MQSKNITRMINPKLKSVLKKEENLSKLWILMKEKEQWQLVDLRERAILDLEISPMTLWNYLVELDKLGLISLQVKEEEDNPSKRKRGSFK